MTVSLLCERECYSETTIFQKEGYLWKQKILATYLHKKLKKN